MHIVVLDGETLNPGDLSWEAMSQLGALEVHGRSAANQLLDRAAQAHVLVNNKVRLGAEQLAALPQLELIALTSTGYDVVDLQAAAKHDVTVCNVPEYSTASVAQHTFALLLELTNHVGRHDQAARDGSWTASGKFCFPVTPLSELAGKTMGLIGFGRIGQGVGRIAHAMGMRVLATTRSRSASTDFPFEWADLDDLLAVSDVVSLHLPLSDASAKMIDGRRLAQMKPSAFLINTARGGLVDEQALANALGAGTIAGAAVDVVSVEPITPDNPLARAVRCIITPHIAWASLESRARLMDATVQNIRAFIGGSPQNVVE